ncbi:GTPase activating protein (SH3 domain) binding protein [Bulinus truncatus]|nr:GTPase activating protein (SH3 domain) binding protein [Bulinus truncatus]
MWPLSGIVKSLNKGGLHPTFHESPNAQIVVILDPICAPSHVYGIKFTIENYLFLTMVMETPGPQEVGREFVRQYYTMLHEAPLHLHRFYSNNSAFVHGGVEKAGNEQPPVIGQEAIHKKIVSLNFNDCHAKIRQVDAQATVEDSVVVQVTGELSNNGEPMRRFMQTFVLVPQTPKKFYVHNDIFRYQDEVFHDDDGDVDDSDRFITDPRDALDNGEDQAPQSPEVSSPYYDQVPLSNGTALEEPIKVQEPTSVHIQAPTTPQKQEVEIVPVVEREPSRVDEVSVPEEKYEHKNYEQKGELKPVAEPPQQEFNEPQPGPKPVTWAALASKNTPGGGVPTQSSYTAPPVSHVSKPPPSRNELPKQDLSSQPPQAQRAPRAPRERFVDRERNSVSRGDGDGDADSVNGRRSNSVGGGGSKYSDNQQLFVGNLPLNITEAELKEFFEQYGRVEELRINTKSGGGKVPNFGFVVFENADIVQEILKVKASHGIKYKGEHRLNVEEKKPRSSDGLRSGGRGMPRGGGMGGQGMGRSSGPPYGDRGGPGGRGNLKGSSGFNRQDMRGSPNLAPRGGMSQGRR